MWRTQTVSESCIMQHICWMASEAKKEVIKKQGKFLEGIHSEGAGGNLTSVWEPFHCARSSLREDFQTVFLLLMFPELKMEMGQDRSSTVKVIRERPHHAASKI